MLMLSLLLSPATVKPVPKAVMESWRKRDYREFPAFTDNASVGGKNVLMSWKKTNN
jgi:hypothetical protein